VRSERRDAVFVAAVSLAVRLAVVVWAAGRFPPTADGRYYHQIATRIAEGHGYTWLWPDGAVTYAAHYPVGYPAMVALGYAVFGAKPVVAMTTNALVGAAAAVAAWSLLRRGTSRGARLALAGGLAVGLHPVLVPYTAAVMTEGVTASLLVVAAAVAAGARDAREPRRWIVLTGVLMGIATLVRPQSLALAPVLGWLAVTGRAAGVRRAATGAAAVTALALAVCAPWTARNCVRMERCALVSVNGGWNLAIGVQTETGGWHEISVPEACKTVFQEAAKDACYGREPLRWLARAPAKLRMTFDYFGAAPWYLHDANASSFPHRAKVALGAVETLVSRLFLAAALVALLRIPPPRTGALGRARTAAVAVGLVACVLVPGTIGYLALALGVAALGPSALRRAPLVIPFSAAVIVATAATHAVFFGAGRYGIIVVPFVTMLAFVRAPEREGEGRPVA
jgi:4-amino-4-deoxy-L-arabinose transferase-like glycosyltransferase